jgi:hypothetical protein
MPFVIFMSLYLSIADRVADLASVFDLVLSVEFLREAYLLPMA